MTETILPEEAAAFLREVAGEDWTVEPLAGDASVRAYYRIRRPDGSTMMLTHYPPELRQQLRRFVRIYEDLAPHAPLPEVLSAGESTMLQRDVGDRTLFDVLRDDHETGVRLYRAAIDILRGIQQAKPKTELLAPFTADFFYDELLMTCDFYFQQILGRRVEPILPLLREIAERVASHPFVLCHRDYHGENIHVINGDLFVIDYQDLRMGPDTYDLASLLRDRGVIRFLGEDVEMEFVDYYGCPRQRYFETLLQRSIKILGTWAKQFVVRKKTKYLDFIPPTMESIHRCTEELPEFRQLGDVFR